MDIQELKEIYAKYHALKQETKELDAIAVEKEDKVKEILGRTFPWAHWYEYSYIEILALFISLAGLTEVVKAAALEPNPHQYLFDYLDSDSAVKKDDDYSDDEKSVLTSLLMNVLHQMSSISIFSQSLSELVKKAEQDDEALFDAVLVDRSTVACAPIARRIQYAQMINDESFMEALSKAISRTRPRRPAEDYDDLRYMIEAADELKVYDSSTKEELFDIFATDLQLYKVDSKQDPLSGFKRLLERRDKRKAT